MSKISIRWGWFIGIAICGSSIWSTNCAFAQIIPDGTLPNNSSVKLEGNNSIIEGGTQAGGNLFHSFREFSVPTNGVALFNNAADIQNIISRVTGGSVSNIDGLIYANGTANLFLINPNGIVFGQNAQLNVGGSFVATTANAIVFGNQGFFSASNPESSSSLLTVNPTALLFNQIKIASIENNSVAPSGLNPSSEFIATGLRVPDGKSLLLVGGDINMNGGALFAFGGRVELGGLASAGIVGLNEYGNNLSLSFPNSVERSDVSLSNGAGVNVAAGDGGSIAVNTRNLEMTGESGLFAGIDIELGSDLSKAGNIEINATGAINLHNVSEIANYVGLEAKGQGGDINITANTLQTEGGSQVVTGTSGAGKGGDLIVDVQDVEVIGESADGRISYLGTSTQTNSTGDAGDLTIKTNTLLVRDGAQVNTSTFGKGKGGNLSINADKVQVIGMSDDRQVSSGLFAEAGTGLSGNAGDLTINAGELLIQNGANVSADTFGSGNGGNLSINAGKVLIQDGVDVSAATFGSGNGGNLSINADKVLLFNESADSLYSSLTVQADKGATGDAGDLTINTGELLVQNGAQVTANTFGSGNGGNLSINADKVRLIGRSDDNRFPSGLSVTTERSATGDAGNLTINTGELLIQDGAQAGAATFSSGNGGNLTVIADKVQLIGRGSALTTSAQRNSTGKAGELTIKTRELLIQNGAQVSAATFGTGNGGNLTVTADKVQLIGTGSALAASAQRNSIGNAGDLTIKTNTLLVQDKAFIAVESLGIGTAGNMTLNARSIRVNNDAFLSADTRSAKVDPNREQATININSGDLIISRNSNIFTNATGENVIGGNININTDFLVGFENSDISANSANFRGGNVRINAQGVFGIQFRDIASDKTSDITATGVSSELSGTVKINTPDVDPNNGLVNLPTVPVNTEVAQTCQASGSLAKSSFTITGRGGLPPNPGEALNTDAVQVDLVTLNPSDDNRSSSFVPSKTTTFVPEPIIEATSLALNQKGEVVLTANLPTTTPHSPWLKPASCRAAHRVDS
ncbi:MULTISPECIES: filamentous hemagglutinin N-terminal domain-containing protein [unclassified Nostoc]|uniref:two-partner secretion domain-containing protein n=1 Tax=unclassified Nostoc TaxID=2593658 RepID=UPI002ADC745C|nr:filamentous hemagglutinin N-terminal domain-containing protein [Nostoc sp. DedQUE02]